MPQSAQEGVGFVGDAGRKNIAGDPVAALHENIVAVDTESKTLAVCIRLAYQLQIPQTQGQVISMYDFPLLVK
jgi:hypothetical protein